MSGMPFFKRKGMKREDPKLMQRLYALSALPEEEVATANEDIEKMLAMFATIREVDTTGVEPMHTLPYEGAPICEEEELPEAASEAAVDVESLNPEHMLAGLFVVPYTLEKGGT